MTRLSSLLALALVACSDGEGPSGGAPTSSASIAAEPVPPTAVPSGSSSVATVPVAAPPKVRPALPDEDLYPKSLDEQREAMLRRMKVMLELDEDAVARLRKILEGSKIVGQGNPDIVEYAMTRKECRERREKDGVNDPDFAVCGAPFMVPLYDPKAGQKESDAKACIDRFEFPNVPCDYPVTWVGPRDASEICKSIGKRLCDAHEWEGACAGAVHDPDVEYAWKLPRKDAKNRHNEAREIVWAYGAEKDHKKCGMASHKSEKCEKSGWKKCGSNTYPAGSFPGCKSPLGVYDQHGNVAEHMNLPLEPEQLASRGGLGETEMKGSWFVFEKFEAHTDDCRWRAPDWHATKIKSHDGHANYHLGFRCCKDANSPAR